MKKCPRCGITKPLDQFYADPKKPSGVESHCKDCKNAARKARYHANLPYEQQRSRDYYRHLTGAERSARIDRTRAWAQANPEVMRQRWREAYRRMDPTIRRNRERVRYMRRHGGAEEWARMYAEQDGLCYLCLLPLLEDGKDVHVDHDHTCCDAGPRNSTSCRYCRRGLTHQACNQIWGLARENPALLRIVADEGERVRDETRLRIAAKPAGSELGDEMDAALLPQLDEAALF